MPDMDLLILGGHGLSGVVALVALAVKFNFSEESGANGKACKKQ